MKITFEASTSGFEQVSRALEQQQKLLNENAEAAERLSKAQSGIGRTSTPGGQDSLNYFRDTAKSIKDVTGALQQLNQTQSGLQSFMSMFSGFRRELNEAAADQKGGVFQVLATQVDTLKKNMASSALSIRSIKDEIKDLERAASADPKNPNLRAQLSDARGFLSAEQQSLTATSYLANQARIIQLMQQPLGTTMAGMFGGGGGGGIGGFLSGMGPSPASIMRRAAIAGIGIYAGNKAGEFISNVGAADDLARISNYKYEMGIAQDAMQGSVGESFMRSRGIGKFGAIGDVPGGREGMSNSNQAMAAAYNMGNGFSEVFGNMFSVFKTQAKAMVTEFRFATGDEFTRVLGQRAAKLSEDQIDAISRTSSMTRQNLLSGEFGRLESQLGYGASRYMQGQLSRSGISLGEANPTLELAARAGLNRSSLITMAPQLMASNAMLGVSDNVKFQLFRQAAGGQPGAITGAISGLEQYLGGVQNTGIDVRSNFAMREQVGDYVAGLQSQFGLPVSADRAGGRFLGALQQTAGSGLSAGDRIKAASDMDQMTRARIGNTKTIESMGINAMLMRSGISPYARAMIMERLATDPEKAAEVISKLTGRGINDVKDEVKSVFKGVQSFRRDLTGSDTQKGAAEDKILKDAFGVSMTSYMQTGTTMGATSVAMTQIDSEGLGPFGKATGPAVPIAITDQGTQQRALRTAEAKQQENIMSQFEDIAKKSGGSVASILTETFEKYTTEITDALQKIKSDLPVKFQDSNPSPNRAAPTGNVTGAGARGK